MIKNLPANTGDSRDVGLTLGSGRSPGVGNGNLLQYSCLGNSMNRRRLEGYSPWSQKELEVTEHSHTQNRRYAESSVLGKHPSILVLQSKGVNE